MGSSPSSNKQKAVKTADSKLQAAVQEGNITELEKLLKDKKRDVNAKEAATGNTALHYAVAKGNMQALCALLSHRSLEPDLENLHGTTALILAAGSGNIPILQRLVADTRVDINLESGKGETALHSAARRGKEFAVDVLLGSDRCDPNIRCHRNRGNTALHLLFPPQLPEPQQEHLDIREKLGYHPRVDLSLRNDDGQILSKLFRAVEGPGLARASAPDPALQPPPGPSAGAAAAAAAPPTRGSYATAPQPPTGGAQGSYSRSPAAAKLPPLKPSQLVPSSSLAQNHMAFPSDKIMFPSKSPTRPATASASAPEMSSEEEMARVAAQFLRQEKQKEREARRKESGVDGWFGAKDRPLTAEEEDMLAGKSTKQFLNELESYRQQKFQESVKLGGEAEVAQKYSQRISMIEEERSKASQRIKEKEEESQRHWVPPPPPLRLPLDFHHPFVRFV
ncbi:hypothetical protein CYMTET_14010 [Cymbomonas tetramitiformis]|uniref:Uncharacterized protein n=1 Tax=Cymbomonas tetramitiformis TaxID=36881 RepID=A0AAE0GH77_9CHLO|nr:hypothetical protein CYMTET_14010 [Cymbomonas tetramitiformis]